MQAKWILVAVLFLCSAINYADRTSITAVYSLLKVELGFTDIGLGVIGSMFLWSYALGSPLAGYLGDRADRRRIVILSLAGWSIATLLTGFAATQFQLLGMRAVLGIVEALYLPAAIALVAEYHGPETRGTALGVLSIGNFLGLVGGGTLGGYLGEFYGWRSPLFVLGLAGIVLAGICWLILPRNSTRAQRRQTAENRLALAVTMTQLSKIPSLWFVVLAGVLTSIGAWVFINWLPLYFTENFGMTLASAGFFGSSLVSLSAAVSQAGGGFVSDAIARRGAHYRMLTQAILIFCAAPPLLTFVYSKNRLYVMIALVLYSVFRSAGDINLIPLLCDLVSENKRSMAIGITNMFNTLAGAAGIVVAGFLKSSFGLAGVFACVAGILAFDAALLLTCYFLFLKRDLAKAAG